MLEGVAGFLFWACTGGQNWVTLEVVRPLGTLFLESGRQERSSAAGTSFRKR
jgi:hypothetical protein